MILQEPFAISAGARTFTRSLTIDHTQVPSDQTNFPVLVSFTDSTFKTVANGGHVHGTNQFTFSSDSSGATLLKWEVERYNASTGEIIAWVKIGTVSSSSDTVFYLRYGASITTDQSDAVNVWTNSYTLVYHFKDGTTLSNADSTSNALNGTSQGTPSPTATTGKIDGGISLVSANGNYTDVAIGTNPTAVTISAWIKATSFPNAYNTVAGWDRNAPTVQAMIWVKSTGKMTFFVQATGSVGYDGSGSNTLSSGTNYYVALTYDSTSGLVGYVNGSSDGTAAANGALATNSTPVWRVGSDNATGGRLWNGVLDEVRLATVARSANWITTEYNNQNAPGSFITLGAES